MRRPSGRGDFAPIGAAEFQVPAVVSSRFDATKMGAAWRVARRRIYRKKGRCGTRTVERSGPISEPNELVRALRLFQKSTGDSRGRIRLVEALDSQKTQRTNNPATAIAVGHLHQTRRVRAVEDDVG